MKITIKHYDPSKDAAPYDVSYDVPHEDDYMTLLQALVYIHENLAPLSFDYICRGRMCGRCAMMLDGNPVLACVEPISEGSHAVEPLAGLPVVKDLIVDKSQVQAKISETYKRVRVSPLTEDDLQVYNQNDSDDLFGIQYCARCQVCTAACPARKVNSAYIGPSHMLGVAFRHFDPYDQADRIVEAVQGGLWSCIMCGNCTKACNQLEIDHLRVWQKLRDEAMDRGFSDKK
ncbi:MAG: 4Fe-4S dicluster domain-containing protein [Coriobacteriales bacterium]|jgi:succinate dehydrogenase/fumarate reductase iron-sulfur protein|nr:4Fe-4S dicluster domain-containing protein [Coriobacteriales bacterium]